MNEVIRKILLKRGVAKDQHEGFLNPSYDKDLHDSFLLPDMEKAVERILKAKKNDEKIVIYGDYDVDGMTASAILSDAFSGFGLDFEVYIPDRFTEGYGLNSNAIEEIAKSDAKIVVTVDCGSLSFDEIEKANKLGLDVIVTDHHAIAKKLPNAIAVINPHRQDSKYPFKDLAGCGVAFKLVQALQTKFKKLQIGQEKWLLDLVALGTICDIVPLVDENRVLAYWGLKVLQKTRRPGLKALMAVVSIEPEQIDARKIGFVLGPRLNASGRLDNAKLAFELLTTNDNNRALELAQKLDSLNGERRIEQNKIFIQAIEKLGEVKDPVIVIDGDNWNEGVIGIVASKILEAHKKPAFVLSKNGDKVKGSGRSFGDFDLAKAIDTTRECLEKGGGHCAAAGVSLKEENIEKWRESLNSYYQKLGLKNQEKYLLPKEDIQMTVISGLDVELVKELSKLEPFGMGNEQPVFKLENMSVIYTDRIGKEKNHLKMTLSDGEIKMKFIAFNPPEEWFIEPGSRVDAWVNLEINEWQGQVSVEGRIANITQTE